MADFVLIKERRIRKTNIKEYYPLENNKLGVYFSISRYKIDKEVYNFSSEEDRDKVLDILDNMFLGRT